ncbi:MAG: TonB-dependent receptor [Pseudomonadota bacterium]|nr:TonB-dependent receptor [Pseudomonadota bacterium]
MAVLGCLYGGVALAQVTPTPATTEEQEEAKRDEVKTLEKVTVTGSLLRRVEYDTISPVQVLSADVSADIGQVNTAEFLQQSSVAAGSTQITNQFAGFVVEGGTGVQTINLRGLGAQRTAVLLNGQRPGPAGTRGQVLAFDLNVIPQSILQRAEILKDGSSSIYGSDAVAGVVNLITRKNFDGPEFSITGRLPQHGGAETFSVALANGWNFGNGSIAAAAEYYLQQPLRFGDRDFLKCAQDLFTDASGNSIDRVDRSIRGDNPRCVHLLNGVFDNLVGGFRRFVPSTDGTTIGLVPGFRPSTNTTFGPGNTGVASTDESSNFDRFGEQFLIDRQERFSVFATSDFSFGDINWTTEFLYNNRKTNTNRFRQFFPTTGGTTAPASFRYTDGSTFRTPTSSGVGRPILLFPSKQKVEIDYYYVRTGLDGLFPNSDTWSWAANASYTRSDGDYSNLAILNSLSGDLSNPAVRALNGGRAPLVNYYDPSFLNGSRIDELVSAVGRWVTGNTVYDQLLFNGVVTGELFELPAGPIGAALGAEYRRFSIDDQPSADEVAGNFWGQSSAVQTKGTDTVKEIFGEVEVPLLKGLPMVEALTLNMSARAFDYDSVDDSDHVWKLGLSWQVIPSVRLRATKGTSYRAPGLYELFLGDLSGFANQLAIDPCIRFGESTNENIRRNCAAVGVGPDFGGGASSARVISQGGAGVVKPETSEAFTAGIVLTPTAWPISVALDYFDYQVNDEIAQLGAGTILSGCYAADVFPNDFCNLFIRNPANHPTNPNAIVDVFQKYVNVNKQKVRGYDLLTRFNKDFAFGKLEIEGQATYVMEDFSQFFSTAEASGFGTNNRNGAIGRPKLAANLRTQLKRGDFAYTWFMNYVDQTQSLTLNPVTTYFGFTDAVRDIVAEDRLYHTVSVRYNQPKWSVLFGVQNVLDEEPPTVSAGVATRYGNVPAFATQYDLRGRTFFSRLDIKF